MNTNIHYVYAYSTTLCFRNAISVGLQLCVSEMQFQWVYGVMEFRTFQCSVYANRETSNGRPKNVVKNEKRNYEDSVDVHLRVEHVLTEMKLL